MRRLLGLAIIGVFVISLLGLTGCGYLKEEKFNQEFSTFKTQNENEHNAIKGNVSNLDKKVDQQKESLGKSIDKAKNDAIAASEQGDADTISAAKTFSKEQDNALRSDMEDSIQKAKNDANKFSKSGDKKLRAEIAKLNRNVKSNVAKLNRQLSGSNKMLKETKKLAEKSITEKAATVYFASGKVSLTDEAKGKLDTAVAAIKNKGSNWLVKVIGHADIRPVLSGKYRNNWDLSYARAVSVKDYLVSKGITNKIEVIARGYTEPIAPPNAKTGQKENRRVEVIIYPPSK